MTFHEKYDPVSKQTAGKFLNHRILIGKKDDIKQIQACLNENVTGDFELMLKEEATDIVVEKK